MIYLLTTDKLWFISQQITHKSWSNWILTWKVTKKTNCNLRFLPTFRHHLKKQPTVFIVTLIFICISYVVDTRKTLHRLTSGKWRLTSAKCRNDVGTAPDSIACFHPVICCKVNHIFFFHCLYRHAELELGLIFISCVYSLEMPVTV